MTGLTIAVGVIVALLLLPSLKTFKLGPVELETVSRPINAEKNIELETVSELIVPIHDMPVYSTQPATICYGIEISELNPNRHNFFYLKTISTDVLHSIRDYLEQRALLAHG